MPVQYSYTSTPLSACTVQLYFYSPMGHMACTEPQCLYKGALFSFHTQLHLSLPVFCVALVLVLLMSGLVIYSPVFVIFCLCWFFHFLSTPQYKILNNKVLAFIILVYGVFFKKYWQFRAANHRKNNTNILVYFTVFLHLRSILRTYPLWNSYCRTYFDLFSLYTFEMHWPQYIEICFF